MITFELPWPPTVNTYWRKNARGMHISKKGVAYQKKTESLCYPFRKTFFKKERLSIKLLAYPPDRRRRDLDNILKGLLDSLQKAQVYEDDEQIDKIELMRMPEKKGVIFIQLSKIEKKNA